MLLNAAETVRQVLLGAIPLSCGIKGRAGKCPHDLRLPIAAYVTP